MTNDHNQRPTTILFYNPNKAIMERYFYAKNGEQVGPFSLQELKEEGITPRTKIWYFGLESWTEAELLPELKGFFRTSEHMPPPIPSDPNILDSGLMEECPKNWRIQSVIAVFFASFIGMAALYFSWKVDREYHAGNLYEANKASQMAGLLVKVSFVFFGIGMIAFGLIIFLFAINHHH